ncbi:MAG: hypothetical protein EP338_11650 [Bacteroidetes bacterium]|nr:MAG: hypothetical protein EP338_11650 [Bacteroidota bacterium]
MKNTLITSLFVIQAVCVTGQHDIKWGETMEYKKSFGFFYPVSKTDFFAVDYKKKQTYLQKYSDFKLKNEEEVNFEIEGKKGDIQTLAIINQKPTYFLSLKKGKNVSLYSLQYGGNCKNIGGPKKLMEYQPSKKKSKLEDDFHFTFSENGLFTCAYYDIPGSKEVNNGIGYNIFSSELESFRKGEFEFPFSEEQMEFSYRFLANNGDYFVLAKIFKDSDRKKNRLVKGQKFVQQIMVFHFSKDGVKQYDISPSIKEDIKSSQTDFSCYLNERDELVVSGIFQVRDREEKDESLPRGVFIYKLNTKNKNVIVNSWKFYRDAHESDEEIFIETKTPKDMLDKRIKPSLQFQFKVLSCNELDNGDIVGVMQNQYRTTTSRSAGNSTITTTRHHFDDLRVFKMNVQGDLRWVKSIPKRQMEIDVETGYNSAVSFIKNGKLYLLFNDNLKNYSSSSGLYHLNKKLYLAESKKTEYSFAEVEMNLTDGEYTRKTLFDFNDHKMFAFPGKFQINRGSNVMMMIFMQGNNVKHGLLPLN